MTIENRGVVDFIGTSKKDGTTILTISDHLEWTDYAYHSTALQDKINDYLEHVCTNKVENAPSNRIRIQLIMKYQPTPQAIDLLRRIEQRVAYLGYEFCHSVYSEE